MPNNTLKTLHPSLQHNSTETSSGTVVKSYSHDNGSDVILCMVHGYPQSSYMWRHMIPLLKAHASLFIPELPGYGISTAPSTPDKKAIATTLLEALRATFPNPSRPIIWCSHDRGARVGHRLLTDSSSARSWNISAAIFMDIVPTLEQWKAFANPAASVAYFHWPFLATTTAPAVIESMGGGKFCRMILERGRSGPAHAVQRLESEGAYEHYCELFDQPETIRGSCADYAEGSVPECRAQEEDQAAGRKVRVPTLVLYSEGSLARMHDVPARWGPWVDGKLECVGIGDGHGHYLPESAPDVVAKQVLRWVAAYAE